MWFTLVTALGLKFSPSSDLFNRTCLVHCGYLGCLAKSVFVLENLFNPYLLALGMTTLFIII
jgi:hypothetical protein